MLNLQKLLVSLAFFIIMHCLSRTLNRNNTEEKEEEEGFSLYEVRRGNIGYNGEDIDQTANQWIKVASINMKKPNGHKALTLELYPKRLAHGSTRQSISVVLRNSDKDAVNPLIYYNNKYGSEGGVSISDINVLRRGTGIDNLWDIWLKMGVSHAEEFPCTWHLENIEETDMVMIENSKNMLSAPPVDLPKFGITKNVLGSGDLENKITDLQNKINHLQSQITGNHNNLQHQIHVGTNNFNALNGVAIRNGSGIYIRHGGRGLYDRTPHDWNQAKFYNGWGNGFTIYKR